MQSFLSLLLILSVSHQFTAWHVGRMPIQVDRSLSTLHMSSTSSFDWNTRKSLASFGIIVSVCMPFTSVSSAEAVPVEKVALYAKRSSDTVPYNDAARGFKLLR
jgi:hypothetical protein